MSEWLRAGREVDASLPLERMTEAELGELRRLLGARQILRERLMVAEQQLELLMLAIRDGRGLRGRVHVDPESGRLRTEDEKE